MFHEFFILSHTHKTFTFWAKYSILSAFPFLKGKGNRHSMRYICLFVCFECSEALLWSLRRWWDSQISLCKLTKCHKTDNWYFCNHTTLSMFHWFLCLMIIDQIKLLWICYESLVFHWWLCFVSQCWKKSMRKCWNFVLHSRFCVWWPPEFWQRTAAGP